jgi:hypothetical protein
LDGTSRRTWHLQAGGRRGLAKPQRFLAVLPGIIFFATFRVDLAVDAAAFFTVRTTRETADFFFAFLAIVTSSI